MKLKKNKINRTKREKIVKMRDGVEKATCENKNKNNNITIEI